MNNLVHKHGGDLDAIERQYGIPKNEISDFSGNINPLGFPKSVAKSLAENIQIVSTYPDRKYEALKKSISDYTGANIKNIVVGNGSTELISVFIKSVNAKKAIIIGPAYSEYEHEISILGSKYTYFPLKEENDFNLDLDSLIDALKPDIELLIMCNPNNPTGTAIAAKQMEKILIHCNKNNTKVMVDETYIEFSDNLNEICSIPLANEYDNIFVIRGISKFFAAPGLRLGYAVCSNKNFLDNIKAVQDPWSVNSLAAFAGERLFKDNEFIKQTQQLISTERNKFFDEIKTWEHAKAYNTSSNFMLVKILNNKVHSSEIFEKLIVKKMLIRDASTFTFLDDSFLRFCFLSPEENSRLALELKKFLL